MPYVDKELKKEYQKRTATPYMKEWREKNREKHREYIREWAKKRRMDAAKVKADYEKSKAAPCHFKNAILRQRISIETLDDIYIIGLLTRRPPLTREAVRLNPEIIDLHRTYIITNRKLKNNDYNSNQLG